LLQYQSHPVGAGLQHGQETEVVAHPPGCFNPHLWANGLSDQPHVLVQCQGIRAEPCAGLDERRAGSLDQARGLRFLHVAQEGRLDDHLDRYASGTHHGTHVLLGVPPVSAQERAQVQHHVNLASAIGHCLPGLIYLHLGSNGAHRKTDAGDHLRRRPFEDRRRARHMQRVDADLPKALIMHHMRQRFDLSGRGRGSQQGHIQHLFQFFPGDVHSVPSYPSKASANICRISSRLKTG